MVNKMGLESSNPAVHASSSLCAGFVGACMGTPADVIKTRVMNQPLDEEGIQLELGRKRLKEKTPESYHVRAYDNGIGGAIVWENKRKVVSYPKLK